MHPGITGKKLLNFQDLRERGVELGKTQIWRLEKAGQFPLRVKYSGSRVAWVADEVDQWLDAKIAARAA